MFEYDHYLKGQPPQPEVEGTSEYIKFLHFILKEYMRFGILQEKTFSSFQTLLDEYYLLDDHELPRDKVTELYLEIPKKYVGSSKAYKKKMLDGLKKVTNILLKGINKPDEHALLYFGKEYLKNLPKHLHKGEFYPGFGPDNILVNNYTIIRMFKCGNITPHKLYFHATFPDNILPILKEGLFYNEENDLPNAKGFKNEKSDNDIRMYKTAENAINEFIKHGIEYFPEIGIFLCSITPEPESHQENECIIVSKDQKVIIEYVIQMKKTIIQMTK